MDTGNRVSWWAAAAGGFLAGVLAVVWGPALLRAVTAATLGPDAKLTWTLIRASGITAYLLLTVGMLFGLGVSTRLFDRLTARVNSFALHEHLSWLALGFTALHTGLLLIDRAEPFSLAQILVPFASAYRPAAVGLGGLALYAVALLTVSFYLKPRLSHRAWRALHYLSFGAYLLATAHGLLAGSDTGAAGMQWLYLLSASGVLFLTLFRVLVPARSGRPAGVAAAPPSRLPDRPAA